MHVPTYAKPLFITDAAVNILPDLEAKRDIVQNAVDLHVGLGLGPPKVAILSAVETVTPKIPSTIEAAALCKMADRGQIIGAELDALRSTPPSAPKRQKKGIRSMCDQAQILVARSRGWEYARQEPHFFQRGRGDRVSARVPIILTRVPTMSDAHGILCRGVSRPRPAWQPVRG
jgi:phosphate acetyltransferase